MENKDRNYFIAIKDEKDKEFIVYASEIYKFSEIDLLNIIKICIIEGRAKGIGRRLLEIYEDILEKDSSEKQKQEGIKKLEAIGLKSNGNRNPTKSKSKER
jgi:hypothetical protein